MMNSSRHAGYPHRDMGVELCQSTYYTFPLWECWHWGRQPQLGLRSRNGSSVWYKTSQDSEPIILISKWRLGDLGRCCIRAGDSNCPLGEGHRTNQETKLTNHSWRLQPSINEAVILELVPLAVWLQLSRLALVFHTKASHILTTERPASHQQLNLET